MTSLTSPASASWTRSTTTGPGSPTPRQVSEVIDRLLTVSDTAMLRHDLSERLGHRWQMRRFGQHRGHGRGLHSVRREPRFAIGQWSLVA